MSECGSACFTAAVNDIDWRRYTAVQPTCVRTAVKLRSRFITVDHAARCAASHTPYQVLQQYEYIDIRDGGSIRVGDLLFCGGKFAAGIWEIPWLLPAQFTAVNTRCKNPALKLSKLQRSTQYRVQE